MSKKYSEEFKKEVVKEYAYGKTYKQIKEIYRVPDATLAGWIKKYGKDRDNKNSITNELIDLKDYRNLEKRVKELEKENNFLKKAAAFFAKEIE